jgi:Methyltransferase domain
VNRCRAHGGGGGGRGPAGEIRRRDRPGASRSSYDLVCLFDCLHDMGDPVGAARRIRQAWAPDGTLLLVEPLAGDGLEDNLTPVGRTFYGLSTVICAPASLA